MNNINQSYYVNQSSKIPLSNQWNSPYDINPPKITSGIRFGTAAATSRGFNNVDFNEVGNLICNVLDSLLLEEKEMQDVADQARQDVIKMCSK